MSFFDSAYVGTPPWDIGRPQKEFVKLEKSGAIVGDVLDAGCGTGENSLFLASRGHRVLGVDSSFRAIQKAKAKSIERSIRADFIVWDALGLSELTMKFDSAIDCGLFHTFTNEDRVRYERNLYSVLKPGGRYFMLAFSDDEPTDWGGPRRITKEEIRRTFSKRWKVDSTKKATFEDLFHEVGGKAWLSAITRL